MSIAIPVRNEADRIGDCLGSLDSQRAAPAFDVLLLLNGCDDDTQTHVSALAPALGFRLHAMERQLPPEQASAEHPRRLAFVEAARRAPGAVLMTTDADACVPPDWIARNLDALARGAEAVAG